MPHPPTTARHAVRRRSGPAFTLIELLVVMAILVILLLVAMPIFDYITGARSTEAGTNMASAMLGRARALALSRVDPDQTKFIGVLFYTDPVSDRDAMQLVEVTADDSTTFLERYLGWQTSATYRPEQTNPARPADVVYSQSLDTKLGGTGSSFANRPVIKRYVAINVNTGTASKPPNGPTDDAGDFKDNNWNSANLGTTIPVSLDAEVQYFPRGVRAAVLKPLNSPIIHPGMILFDKQGRVITQRFSITRDTAPVNGVAVDGGEKLLENMGLTTELPLSADRTSGIALAIYNQGDVANPNNVNLYDPTNNFANRQGTVDPWVIANADQYTVSQQTGELVLPPK